MAEGGCGVIKVGTLCYIVRCPQAPEVIGCVVTVVGPMRQCEPPFLPEVEITRPDRAPDWIVEADHYWMPAAWLRPIDSPDQSQDVRHDETVSA